MLQRKRRFLREMMAFAGMGLALAALAPGVVGEGDEAAAGLATKAREFAERFLAGDFDAMSGMMSAELKAAFPASAAETVRHSLTAERGAVKSVGAAWKEAESEVYTRFRVPVEFEKGPHDLRVVFDADGRVAGFFQVPHRPATSERDPDGAAAIRAEPRPDVEGHWEGAIEVPGSPLPVIVEFAFDGSRWSGSFGSPSQGASGLPLESVRVSGSEIEFAIAGIPGAPGFKGTIADGAITGTFTQSGQSLPLTLRRGQGAPPSRPQEPVGELPYDEQSVSYTSGDATLAGTLTLPRGEGPFPAALLVSGSGPQDRNEEVFSHKPFLVLSDALTRAGIAVLRVDDRGVGGSTGSLASVSTADLARDALEGVRFLRKHSGIATERIGLIGHSEGAVIAPLVASESDEVAFIVMLAGTGVPGSAVLRRQLELILRAGGLSEERIAAVVAEQGKLLDLLEAGADRDALRTQVRKLVAAQTQRAGGGGASDAELETTVSAQMRDLSPWFTHFVKYDPRIALRRVKVPVLALCGERDLQVDPKQNLPEIRKALETAGNTDVTVRELPGLNHLFQTAKTGSPQEYYSIPETMSPVVLETVRDWILTRFGPVPRKPSGTNPAR